MISFSIGQVYQTDAGPFYIRITNRTDKSVYFDFINDKGQECASGRKKVRISDDCEYICFPGRMNALFYADGLITLFDAASEQGKDHKEADVKISEDLDSEARKLVSIISTGEQLAVLNSKSTKKEVLAAKAILQNGYVHIQTFISDFLNNTSKKNGIITISEENFEKLIKLYTESRRKLQ